MSGAVEGVDSEAMREAIDAGLRAFCADTSDFTMSSAMRRAAADFIMGQPGMFTTPPARSYADEDRVTIARALAERFIERGNARVTGSVHASWEAMPWSYRRDFLADADAVINVLSQGGKA